MSVLYQQRAAEYRALCLQAYNLAKRRVDSFLSLKKAGKYKGKPLAVITDLDETALDNSASSARAYFHNTTSYPLLYSWWLKGIADSVPGSVSFFKYAQSRGIDIYYITNRTKHDTIVQATMRNMNDLGFPFCSPGDTAHFYFLDAADSAAHRSSKQSRRDAVENKDSVIVLLGDNLIDLDAAFDGQPREVRAKEVDRLRDSWGERYIVFPNAIYGDWESVLYRGFKGSSSMAQRDSMRRLQLDSMEINPKGHW